MSGEYANLSIPPDISNFSLGSSKNTSELYSHQLDIEGHYNLTLKDKTNLTQRCYWRYHPLPWHSILFTNTHGETFPVTLSIRKSCILLVTLFTNTNTVNSVPLWFPSLLWLLGIVKPNLYPPSRNSPGPYPYNMPFGIHCSFFAVLVSYLYSPLVPIFTALYFISFPSFSTVSLISSGMKCWMNNSQ